MVHSIWRRGWRECSHCSLTLIPHLSEWDLNVTVHEELIPVICHLSIRKSQWNVYIRDFGGLAFYKEEQASSDLVHHSHINANSAANSLHFPLFSLTSNSITHKPHDKIWGAHTAFNHCIFFLPPSDWSPYGSRWWSMSAYRGDSGCRSWTLLLKMNFDLRPSLCIPERLNVDPIQAGDFTCGHLCKHGNQDPLYPSGTANCCSVGDNSHTNLCRVCL